MNPPKRRKSIITRIAIIVAGVSVGFITPKIYRAYFSDPPAPIRSAVLTASKCKGVEQTPLHKAIDAGKFEKVWYRKIGSKKAWKQIKPEYVNVSAQYGYNFKDVSLLLTLCETPLHRAAFRGNASREFIDALIAAGADVEAKDGRGETPLHRAAFTGSTETAQTLIAVGADVNAKNDYGETPLDVAVGEKNTETAHVISAAGGKFGKS